jgi:phosphoserine phosphatase
VAHVLAGGQAAAFFDLDRTLIAGSANFPLAVAAFRAGLVSPRDIAHDAVNALAFGLRGASDARSEALRDRILRAVTGVRTERLRALGEIVVPQLAASVFPEARR